MPIGGLDYLGEEVKLGFALEVLLDPPGHIQFLAVCPAYCLNEIVKALQKAGTILLAVGACSAYLGSVVSQVRHDIPVRKGLPYRFFRKNTPFGIQSTGTPFDAPGGKGDISRDCHIALGYMLDNPVVCRVGVGIDHHHLDQRASRRHLHGVV